MPLLEGAEYSYEGSGNGKKDTFTIRLVSTFAADQKWYYFLLVDDAQKDDAQKDDALIIGNFPWLGAFLARPSGLVGFVAPFRGDVKLVTKDQLQVILVFPLKKGQTTKVRVVKWDYQVRVDDFETVTVPAGTFKECAKIVMARASSEGEGGQPVTFWLARGVGMVKWIRDTGRVDQLVAYKITQ